MTDLIDEIDLSLSAVISRIRTALNAGPTAGPWLEGHLCDDDHPCNCGAILSDTGIMGAVATVHHDNGLPVGEGGNDAPPKSEAKANQLLISACHPLAIELLLKTIEDQASILDRVKQEVRRTPDRFRVTYSNPDGGEATLQRHPEGEFVTFDTYSKVCSIVTGKEAVKNG
jgi:hypothetical protein